MKFVNSTLVTFWSNIKIVKNFKLNCKILNNLFTLKQLHAELFKFSPPSPFLLPKKFAKNKCRCHTKQHEPRKKLAKCWNFCFSGQIEKKERERENLRLSSISDLMVCEIERNGMRISNKTTSKTDNKDLCKVIPDSLASRLLFSGF